MNGFEERQTVPNPYTSRMGLADPDLFVGRAPQLRDLHNHLSAPKPSSVAILGPSRIGKTSLMEQALRNLEANKAGRALCVRVSPQTVTDRASMCKRLSAAMVRAADPDGGPSPDSDIPEEFEACLSFVAADRPVVFFMDDLDDWSFPDDDVRVEMFNTLRGAAWQNRFALCVTTRHPLIELCTSGGGEGSLLWNVVSTIQPGLLNEQEAKTLILRPHGEAGLTVTDEEWELVFEEAGTHPCLAQIAGYRLFDAKQEATGPLGHEQMYYLQQEIHRDVSALFPVFVRYIRERDSTLLAAAIRLARHEAISHREEQGLRDLGAAYRTPTGPKLLSGAFSEHILSEPAPAPITPTGTAMNVSSPPGHEAGRVFISHSSADREFAKRVAHDLLAMDVDVWIDGISIPPGEKFDRAIENALASASHVVLVVTPDAVKSDYVRAEVEWAQKNDIKVIPIIREMAQLPPRWHTLQSCDATTEELYEETKRILATCLPLRHS